MVAIKDMEMPKSCGECNCSGTGVCKEWVYLNGYDLGKKRADTCPLVDIEEHKVDVQITIYGETHSVYKIIHKYMTMDEYHDILREYYNPNREDIHVYLTKHWYNYENDIFYIDAYRNEG